MITNQSNRLKQRMNLFKVEPKAYQAMSALEGYLNHSHLSVTHKELLKIRASQINSCAFCLQMHTKEARKAGETEERIYALNAWRESPLYTEEERVILALTEEITLVSQYRVSDEAYQAAARLFDEHYLAQLIMAIVTINAWNRIAVATRLLP
jgi:AhpD family alkylhydroperoxidase